MLWGMDWASTKLLSVALVVSVAACSDDGVAGGDQLTASSTGGADTNASGQAGSSGEESAGGTSGIDPSGAASTSGNSTGADSTGNGAGGSVCTAQCIEDADCFSNGVDLGLTCSDNGFCHTACEDAADCIPALSGWVAQPCDSSDTCPAGPCIDYGGDTGGCATAPPEMLDCAGLMLDEIEATDVDGNPVTVCGESDGLCTLDPLGDMSCTLGCEATGCSNPLTCESDGSCHCASDDDCLAANTGDTCGPNGVCFFGCEDVTDCEASLGAPALDGQTLHCE